MPKGLSFVYRNWKGEIAERHIIPDQTLEYLPPGKNDHHPEGGFMLSGQDLDRRRARRSFRLTQIIGPITEFNITFDPQVDPQNGIAEPIKYRPL